MGPFEWIAPKTYNRWRTFRLKRYKRKKVKEMKLIPEQHYHIKFKVKIGDKVHPQSCGEYDIVIPATGIYFAKIKLQEHLERMISAEVIEFDVIQNSSDSSSESSSSSI